MKPMSDILTSTGASAAIEDSAWRLILGSLVTSVAVHGSAQALQVAHAAVDACGDDADAHLHVDLRPGRVELRLRTPMVAGLTSTDVDVSRRITDARPYYGRDQHVERPTLRADAGDRHRCTGHPGDPAVLEGGDGLRRRARIC